MAAALKAFGEDYFPRSFEMQRPSLRVIEGDRAWESEPAFETDLEQIARILDLVVVVIRAERIRVKARQEAEQTARFRRFAAGE
jgi:hypothetical protein